MGYRGGKTDMVLGEVDKSETGGWEVMIEKGD